jgi:hypothetical protein
LEERQRSPVCHRISCRQPGVFASWRLGVEFHAGESLRDARQRRKEADLRQKNSLLYCPVARLPGCPERAATYISSKISSSVAPHTPTEGRKVVNKKITFFYRNLKAVFGK